MRSDILLEIHDRLYETFGPQHWWPGETPFEIMIGAILTQNTNWRNVERAIANLREANLLDARRLAVERRRRIAALIRPAGYFNIKAERLKQFVGWFMARCDGNVAAFRGIRTPVLRRALLTVKGIGPETADSILLYALNRRVFVVDAYTRRVLSRHGLADVRDTYDTIRAMFETRLPKSVRLYNEYHALFVRLGKEICRPRPRCEACPLRSLLGPPQIEAR